MKKVILGSVMLISGILGFIGLMLSNAIKVSDDSVLIEGGISQMIFGEKGDVIFELIFISLSLFGFIIGTIGAFQNKID